MNEIEKLYKNTGIKKIELDYPDNFEPFYPEFTAEKQLELIKWLLYNPKVDNLNMFYKNEENYLEISIDCKNGYSYENSFDDNFEITIASAINTIWQDLTEEERKQIRDILAR